MAFANHFLLADELLLNIEIYRQRYNLKIKHRELRDFSNAFEIPENRFLKIFRLSRRLAFDLFIYLDRFMPQGERSTFIPNHLKVLLTLNFFGYGSYQGIVGEDFNFPCSQATVSRIITLVTNVMTTHLMQIKIKLPTDEEEIKNIKKKFLNNFGFPNVLGCIDGTHIAIISPPVEHEIYPGTAYFNRKGYTSINTLIICDADLKILAINARYPGSTHDAAIWQMSSVAHYLRTKYFNGELRGWLLGDSGFPLQPWLLTPVVNAAENTPESRYTKRHCLARNTIERLNGVLKNRFRCLLKSRALHYLPPKAGKIIYSCAILHNMCLEYSVPEIHDDEAEEDDNEVEEDENLQNRDVEDEEGQEFNILRLGRRTRQNLINTYFIN